MYKLPEIKNILKYDHNLDLEGLTLHGVHKLQPFKREVYILSAFKQGNFNYLGIYCQLKNAGEVGAILISCDTYLKYDSKGKPKKVITGKFLDTIAHESLHAVVGGLQAPGVDITDIQKSEELFAYLVGELTAEVFNLIMNKSG